MIKSFEQFNKVCESATPRREQRDYVSQMCNLAFECVMYCIDIVKDNGYRVDLDKPYGIYIQDKTHETSEYKNISAFEVRTQNRPNEECELYFNKNGEYLVVITDDDEEYPVENQYFNFFEMGEISDVLECKYRIF